MGFVLLSAATFPVESVPEWQLTALPAQPAPQADNIWHRYRVRLRWWRKILSTRLRPAAARR